MNLSHGQWLTVEENHPAAAALIRSYLLLNEYEGLKRSSNRNEWEERRFRELDSHFKGPFAMERIRDAEDRVRHGQVAA
jgi:hypothetical protein